ncbi:tetratricopeptide repeat domain containing protein [Colletotrichum incanum]|uniref:Tetratricopeptide repeat domain containing protein n=1 Tax=Colletotrichum incanum TaxID=1573173 RepID=A0A167DX05_COLIC|nr:tetratricopeptide repeat domain containing protein [Colletotrichum incanum]
MRQSTDRGNSKVSIASRRISAKMVNPEALESWPNQTAQLLSNTKILEYRNTRTPPHREYYDGVPGYCKTVDGLHENYRSIEGLCQPAEVRDASQCLLYEGAVHTENCYESTLQSIATPVVFRESQFFGSANSAQFFGYSKDEPHQPKGQIGGILGLGGAPCFHGQPNAWEVTGDRTTAQTWMASPPSMTGLSNRSSSPRDMCIMSLYEDPLTRHQFTSHPYGSPPYVMVPAESPPKINVRPKFVETGNNDVISGQKKPMDFAGRMPSAEQVALSPITFRGHALASNRSKRRLKEGKEGSRKRRTMTEEERQAIADTRQIGACIRCRMQRLKCDANPEDRQGPCLTCARVDMNSAKVVHRQPCIRTKLSDVVLYRDPCTVNAERGGRLQTLWILKIGMAKIHTRFSS